MKRVFKWLLWIFLSVVALAVVVLVVLLLTYNSFIRMVMERSIRAQTGMKAEIGSVDVALMSPTLEIKNFKLFNSPDFNSTPFFIIPEIYVEYDRDALKRRELHVTQMRFNLGELDIVKNQAGQTNIFLAGIKLPSKKSSGGGGGNNQVAADFQRQTGIEFKGIDELKVSIGTVKFIDLQDPHNSREQDIGIEDCVIKNVKSPTDLAGLGVLIALRSDGFFESLVDQKNSKVDVLKLLGQ
jgi:uncharacterized protein involved in outer membrane biogenesis